MIAIYNIKTPKRPGYYRIQVSRYLTVTSVFIRVKSLLAGSTLQ